MGMANAGFGEMPASYTSALGIHPAVWGVLAQPSKGSHPFCSIFPPYGCLFFVNSVAYKEADPECSFPCSCITVDASFVDSIYQELALFLSLSLSL